MKKNITLFLLAFSLAGCSTFFKETEPAEVKTETTKSDVIKKSNSGNVKGVPPAPAVAEEPGKTGSAKADKVVAIEGTNSEVADKVSKAMENFVFKAEKEEFASFCRDVRIDCTVNGKSFPKGKKKVARTSQPFFVGSKNGLQGTERLIVKFKFYPN